MNGLAQKKCVPCLVGMPPLPENKAREMLSSLKDWELIENAAKIQKNFQFKDFAEAMGFVDKVAEIAEKEGHHPDIFISYSRVVITLYTHKIKGLHENDFILAAKIDEVK